MSYIGFFPGCPPVASVTDTTIMASSSEPPASAETAGLPGGSIRRRSCNRLDGLLGLSVLLPPGLPPAPTAPRQKPLFLEGGSPPSTHLPPSRSLASARRNSSGPRFL